MSSAPTSPAGPIVRPAPAAARSTQTDWHDQAEQVFLTHLAQQLDAASCRRQGEIADPGGAAARSWHDPPAYSHALRGAVRAEIDKDLVKHPVHDIEKHLTAEP